MSLYNNKWRNWSCHLIWTSCREKICTFKSQLKWTEIHTEISTTYFVLKVDFRSHDHLCKCLCKAYKCIEKLHYKGYFLVLISNSLLTTIRFPFPPTPPWLSNLQFLLSTQLKTLLSLYFFPTNLLKKSFVIWSLPVTYPVRALRFHFLLLQQSVFSHCPVQWNPYTYRD